MQVLVDRATIPEAVKTLAPLASVLCDPAFALWFARTMDALSEVEQEPDQTEMPAAVRAYHDLVYEAVQAAIKKVGDEHPDKVQAVADWSAVNNVRVQMVPIALDPPPDPATYPAMTPQQAGIIESLRTLTRD